MEKKSLPPPEAFIRFKEKNISAILYKIQPKKAPYSTISRNFMIVVLESVL
jgi:hypothetical protein